MIYNEIIKQARQNLPVTAMLRSLLERCFSAKDFDALFQEHAQLQYTRTLLFSSVVTLMIWVVSKIRPSINVAVSNFAEMLGVSRTSVYNKLNGIETQVSAAIVAFSASRLIPIIEEMGTLPPPLLPGYQVRIVDGNCIAASHHRIEVLRKLSSGPMPGKALVIFDPQRSLATHMIPCEDAHAQERSLFKPLLELIKAGELTIADRNFCTRSFLQDIHDKQSFFVIREHAKLPWTALTDLVQVDKEGKLFEQTVELSYRDDEEDHTPFMIRRIVRHLDTATRDGDTTIAILTNLPQAHANAATVADLYSNRWSIEKHFGFIERALASEVSSIGMPKAALFILAISLLIANMLSVIMAALQHANPDVDVKDTVSPIQVTTEIQGSYFGLMKFVGDEVWECFSNMKDSDFAEWLIACAKNVSLVSFKKGKRGPKKTQPKRELHEGNKPHVSTYRLLEEKRLRSKNK